MDMLRARREDYAGSRLPEPIVRLPDDTDPESTAVLADSVGLALLVVLESLTPAERLAFVLHDMFAVPFAEIAPIIGTTPRYRPPIRQPCRRRVRGAAPTKTPTSATSAPSSTRSWPPHARATSARS
jgi:RNA polymerase sigma-70 factor (ECF subfamily)